KESIQKALEYDIHCFNVESAAELDLIESVAVEIKVKAPSSIRVNPNVDSKTHPYISTGLTENKFGVDPDVALSLYKKANLSKYLNVCGLDYHIGSQITDTLPFMEALDRVLELIDELKNENIHLKHIDIGGGIGVTYNNEETIDIEKYIQSVVRKVGNLKVMVEPGRSIVGNAGIFVTKVEYLKQNDLKSFAIIDGAMNDLLRPALYGSYHQAVKVIDKKDGINASWDLVGPVCETADFLAKDRNLNLKEGDYIAIMTAGAYGFVFSYNNKSIPRVAEVIVSGNSHAIVRKRETIESLFVNETIFKDEIN
ncbi:MAG: diaminopimelate decarboxylase, partial [Candidatus Thioglobus sp.]|nr:diaminopimelate decarboxylase [Candidatus Thioglobus sp.]